MLPPRLYFDLASPYAYLACERAESVLGCRPMLYPVLLGAMFPWRGYGSWAHGPEREVRIADIERRAGLYGLPALVWPPDWPANTLAAMRACVWAREQDALHVFTDAVYREQFAGGADIADLEVLARCAERAGLDAAAMLTAIGTPAIKATLKQLTAAAWEAGVRGVPTVQVAQTLIFGDDRLDEAAALNLSPGGQNSD